MSELKPHSSIQRIRIGRESMRLHWYFSGLLWYAYRIAGKHVPGSKVPRSMIGAGHTRAEALEELRTLLHP